MNTKRREFAGKRIVDGLSENYLIPSRRRVLVPENLSLQSYLQLCYGSESLIVFNYGCVYVLSL